jgi:beta-lactamase superfamily II metal-dependent hydrolase
MPSNTFHFLNVKDGDCSIIEHPSGHVSIIDVCNARHDEAEAEMARLVYNLLTKSAHAVGGNFQQKKHPVNPVTYLRERDISSVFRFLLTHPDMDHMDGIKDFFDVFRPANFYDTDNNKEMDWQPGAPYRKEDWDFYRALRDGNPQSDPKRITIYPGDDAAYRTQDWNGNRPGDAFYVLAPTRELVATANESSGDYHDASYVILHHTPGGKIILAGDSHDATWEFILDHFEDYVRDADLLIAPHHGRDSDRSYQFLNVVNPKMTFFGNARSEHLAYDAWRSRGLEFVTNNQANCMVVDTGGQNLTLYVTYENFARAKNPQTFWSERYKAWYVKEVTGWDERYSNATMEHALQRLLNSSQ